MVLLSAVVGLADVPQTTPCWVGLGIPSAVTVPCPMAVVLSYIRDCLRGDRRREQSRESDITPIHGANIIGGISTDMIERAWSKAGDAAGEGAWRTDRTIHSFAVQ